ncbi:YheC/YheD family endospore coat-associated protein [Paenibacillus pini]|uniref:ATP-grasp domain-containing protein n=1 Tax=Paenibacillus pini JCM 16418 TaxID=1236976 RepID=W7YJK2_9BACL|nr:YheC/YheD family protein [Paenibacillus pini]GAF08667.1 hypothetical protein JCM16418_2755 [Paenibacillus pini JCM 16418]
MWISYVGILVNAAMHKGIPQRRTGQESITNYEEAARSFGLIPCFMRLQDIHLESGQCLAYVLNNNEYARIRLPIPRIIHNRALYFDKNSRHKIELMLGQGYRIFNAYNRYGKDEIHHVLCSDTQIAPHLPETINATSLSIKEMMRRYDDMIIKPCAGSVGKGLMRLRYKGSSWTLKFSRSGRAHDWHTLRLRRQQLPVILLRRMRSVPFIVQERINLAEYNKRPFDLRVSVQRGINGQWDITGMFAKVAASNAFVSNVAQGGSVFPVNVVLPSSLPNIPTGRIVADVRELSMRIVMKLERHLPMVADFGLDIGITSLGKPYFIECNGRDQRYGFHKAGMYETWKDSYRQPMAYARYLHNSQDYIDRVVNTL